MSVQPTGLEKQNYRRECFHRANILLLRTIGCSQQSASCFSSRGLTYQRLLTRGRWGQGDHGRPCPGLEELLHRLCMYPIFLVVFIMYLYGFVFLHLFIRVTNGQAGDCSRTCLLTHSCSAPGHLPRRVGSTSWWPLSHNSVLRGWGRRLVFCLPACPRKFLPFSAGSAM